MRNPLRLLSRRNSAVIQMPGANRTTGGRQLGHMSKALRSRVLGSELLESRELLANDLLASSIIFQALSRGGATLPLTPRLVDSGSVIVSSAPAATSMSQVSSAPIVATGGVEGGTSADAAPTVNPSITGPLAADEGPAIIAAADLSDVVSFRLAVTNSSGTPITSINAGETFQLRGFVQSIGTKANAGVYAAFMDVAFDSILASPTGNIDHGTDYTSGPRGTIATGLLDEVGGIFNQLSVPNPSQERLLFTQTFTANAAGTLTFASNPADIVPAGQTLLVDDIPLVNTADIDYGTISLTVNGPVTQDLVQFAKNLTASGAVLYGAAWDAATTAQKQRFQDGESYLNFVDVTNASDRTNKPIATEKQITTKPTWIFGNGQRLEGNSTLAQIATASGVSIPNSDAPSLVNIGTKSLLSGSPLMVALDGFDPNGGPLTYSVTSNNPALVTPTIMPETNSSMRISVAGYGDMIFQLFDDRAPRATNHIKQLANANFYDNLTFHRVDNDFVIQGGDPLGTGAGGSELDDFDDQFDVDLQHNQAGILSMAKSDDDTNDSQFFITDIPGASGPARHLDFNHTIFGYLVEGEANREAVSNTGVGASDKPLNTITMTDVVIFDDTENAVLMLKAPAGATGSTTVTVTVTDALGNSVNQTFTVNVTADTVNNNPFLKDFPQEKYTAPHDTPIVIPVDGIDIEGDAIDYDAEIFFGPENVTVDVSDTNKTVTITPPAGFAGEMQVIIGAFPASRTSFDSQILDLTFHGIDLWEDSDLGDSVFDNLTSANQLEIRVTGVAANSTVKLLKNGTEVGSTTATADGAVFNYNATADSGELLFTAEVTTNGSTTTLNHQLTVTLDRVPATVTSTPPTSVKKGQNLNYNIESSVEGTRKSYEITDAPTGATINDQTGVISWTPAFSLTTTTASFKVKVTDVAGNATSHDFTVTIAAPDPVVRFDVAALDLQGNPITAITKGSEFLVQVTASDLRATPTGNNNIFNAFVDMTYPSSLLTIPSGATGTLTIGPNFATSPLKSGTNTEAGRIDEAGGGNTITSVGPIVVFTQRFVANNVGTASFATERAVAPTSATLHNITLNNPTKTADISEIVYGTLQFPIFEDLFATADTFTVSEDSTLNPLSVLANDLPAGIASTISAVGTPSQGGTVTISSDSRNLLYSPAANFAGTETFTYTLAFGSFAPKTATVTMTVTNTNDPPNAVNDTVQVGQNQTNVVLSLLSNDEIAPDTGETLTITAVTQGNQGGTIAIADDKLSVRYTPNSSYLGTETFTYTVSDGNGGTDTATVTVEVTAPAPNAPDLLGARDSGSSDSDNITKETTLEFAITGVVAGAEVQLFAGGTAIGAPVTATGTSVNISVDAAALNGDTAFTARQTVNSKVSALSTPLTVTIDRTPPGAFTTTPSDTAFVGAAYTYDSGVAETTARYRLNGAPQTATIDSLTGVVTWTPTIADLGTKTFSVVAADLAGNEVSQQVNVNVANQQVGFTVKFVDQANNVITSVGAGSTFTMQVFVDDLRQGVATPGIGSAFTQLSFTDAFLDAIDKPIVAAAFGSPLQGTITAGQIGATGGTSTTITTSEPVLLYSQRFRATGIGNATFQTSFATPTDLIEVTVNGQSTSLPAAAINFGSATLNVVAGLTGVADTPSVNEDSTTTLDVQSNDNAGPSSGTRTIVALSTPSQGGTVSIVENGQKVSYTPKANFFGTETFTYSVKDASDATTTATVTVTVNSVNDVPVANADTASVLLNAAPTQINVLTNDSFAPDLAETLTITAVSAGSRGGVIERINNNSAISYKPAAGAFGTETFTYTISDGNGGTATATVTVTIVEFRTSSVTGKIFRDVNGNSTFDTGEVPLANLQVNLDGTNKDGVAVHRTTRTNKVGDYSFADIDPGNYTVSQVASDVLMSGTLLTTSNPTDDDSLSFVASNEGVQPTANFGSGGLAPSFAIFRALALETSDSVEFASDAQGNTQWQTLDEAWGAFTNVTFTLSADARTVTIQATQTNGTQLIDTVATTERNLVRVMGQVNGTRLVRIVGSPNQFDLQAATSTTTAAASRTAALDAFFANLR